MPTLHFTYNVDSMAFRCDIMSYCFQVFDMTWCMWLSKFWMDVNIVGNLDASY